MLEPRMVAANTHGPLPMQDASETAARIVASSHGGLAMLAIT